MLRPTTKRTSPPTFPSPDCSFISALAPEAAAPVCARTAPVLWPSALLMSINPVDIELSAEEVPDKSEIKPPFAVPEEPARIFKFPANVWLRPD